MKGRWRIAFLLGCLMLSTALGAQEGQGGLGLKPPVEPAKDIDLSDPEASPDSGLSDAEVPADIDLSGTEAPTAIDLSTEDAGSRPKDWRVTLAHEISFAPKREPHLVNNRSWVRLEYSKYFMEHFYARLDSKVNAYWSNDHRAKAEDKTVLFESITPEAYVQYSGAGGRTSLKLGQQVVIWGESEAGAITDEISPRNLSELFFIPLEESRLGQVIANLDYFSPYGDWSFIFVPRPKFNEYPEPGTAYFVDPFNGQADIRDDFSSYRHYYEYAMRWRKAFRGSDISFMGASLIDNDYVLRLDSVNEQGRLQISRLKQRFTMVGGTFNFARGKYLLKGEVAYKTPKAFNDAAFQVIEKNVLDSSLGLTFALRESNTIGFELVNRHIFDWTNEIIGVPQNTNSFVLNANFFFFNQKLAVNWLTIYNWPFVSFTSSLRTAYKWTDNLTVGIDAHLIEVPDQDSPLFVYRDDDQIFFRIQYQF
jgi:hypothetical protein